MLDSVLIDVRAERDRQDRKWGEQNHNLMVWLAVLGEEYGESCKAALDSRVGSKTGKATLADVRMELVQTAAVAVAAIECLDRNAAAWAAVPVE